LFAIGTRRGPTALPEWLQVLAAKMRGDRCRSKSSNLGFTAGALGAPAGGSSNRMAGWLLRGQRPSQRIAAVALSGLETDQVR